MNKIHNTMAIFGILKELRTHSQRNNLMNTHKDCYMHTMLCDNLDALRDELSYWSNKNNDCIIVSHSTSLHGTSYLLSIVYYYIED